MVRTRNQQAFLQRAQFKPEFLDASIRKTLSMLDDDVSIRSGSMLEAQASCLLF
jgi:CRISPR/Cas system-associated endonuclease Cas1